MCNNSLAGTGGNEILPLEIAGQDSGSPLYASAARDTVAHEIILKVVNPADHTAAVSLHVPGLGAAPAPARITTLSGHDLHGINVHGNPAAIIPVESVIPSVKDLSTITLPPQSLTVLRLKMP